MDTFFAKTKAGHDKNQIYFLLKEDEEYVYLVNGTTKPLEKPKKKNLLIPEVVDLAILDPDRDDRLVIKKEDCNRRVYKKIIKKQ